MGLVVYGLATASPHCYVTQENAAELAMSFCGGPVSRQKLLPKLYRRSGVRKRHSVLLNASTNGQPATQSFYPPSAGDHDLGPTTGERMRAYHRYACDLSLRAASEALQDGRIAPIDVTHLVTVTCSGFAAPGIDIHLMSQLQLRPTVARTQIGFMGCHGAINGLRVASGFAGEDSSACALVVAVELCSLHHQYGWDADRIVANALFADGAAALVGGAACERSHWAEVVATGSMLVPDTEELMQWAIADHGFQMSLSPRVPDVIAHQLRPWLEQWLTRHDLTIDQVGSWAIHPGGPRILAAVRDGLGLSPETLADSHWVLENYGNMSSPTVLFICNRLRQREANLPCVVLGFGPGLVIESALLA